MVSVSFHQLRNSRELTVSLTTKQRVAELTGQTIEEVNAIEQMLGVDPDSPEAEECEREAAMTYQDMTGLPRTDGTVDTTKQDDDTLIVAGGDIGPGDDPDGGLESGSTFDDISDLDSGLPTDLGPQEDRHSNPDRHYAGDGDGCETEEEAEAINDLMEDRDQT